MLLAASMALIQAGNVRRAQCMLKNYHTSIQFTSKSEARVPSCTDTKNKRCRFPIICNIDLSSRRIQQPSQLLSAGGLGKLSKLPKLRRHSGQVYNPCCPYVL